MGSSTIEGQPGTAAEPAGDQPREVERSGRTRRLVSLAVLLVGAILFLFPFYYMVVGALQQTPDPTLAGAFPNPANLTLDNFAAINGRVNLLRTLLNSGIFTGGVLLATMVIGLLAGYALAQLEFRGKGLIFNVLLLGLIVPFMLLMIPLYVMIVRWYGLADTYLGMILPFAVSPTAVFIFRQFFRQIPKDLFDSARIDGASEFNVLTRIAVPLAKPAILTAVLVTFIGPWNEFLWPFLVTKDAAKMPLAVALANFITTIASSVANPFGAIFAGATVLALPVVVLFVIFQKRFTSSDLGSGIKG